MNKFGQQALFSHLVNNKLISAHQFGFLPNRCTTMQLVYILETWLHSLVDGNCTVAIFMDFYKAFERVSHTGLLHKLSLLGLIINTSSIDWLNNYLSYRVLHVWVGSAPSRTFPAGVHQGFHPGPVLFLAFVNELPATIPSRNCMLTMHYWTSTAQQTTPSNARNRASHLRNPGHSPGMVDLAITRRLSVCLASPVKIEGVN